VHAPPSPLINGKEIFRPKMIVTVLHHKFILYKIVPSYCGLTAVSSPKRIKHFSKQNTFLIKPGSYGLRHKDDSK
jgi:hypothetical protein